MDDSASQLTYSDGEDDHRITHRCEGTNNSETCSEEDDNNSSARADVDEDDDELDQNSQQQETIALFGAYGPTGHHFMRLALDAGYKVRALVTPGVKLDQSFDDLYTVMGTLEDAAKIQEVVYGSTYVVCMLGETLPRHNNLNYPRDCLQKFLKVLYPIMTRQDDPVVLGFLFQATALAADANGKAPLFSKVVKKINRKRSAYLQDVDAAIQWIHSQHDRKKKADEVKEQDRKVRLPLFPYIVTRPGVLREGPSTKKLAASKSVRSLV